MALVYEQGWANPTSTARIYLDTNRNGAQVTINATVVCTLTYSSGFINYDGEINFNMWCSGGNASTNIKGYYDRWAANTDRTRTRYCSMTVTNTSGNIDIGFNMTIPSSRPSGAAFRIDNQVRNIGLPGFNSPSAPTWISTNPNPCGINASPVITWGGASAGSLGRLYYDVEVQCTKSTGEWTDWLRISNAQGATSYNEIVLKNMNIYGVTPYIGIRYQYRVRSSDGSYSTSAWVYSILNVSFGNPTPPTSYTLSNTSIKKDGSITINWSRATGGTGSISQYYLEYRIYNNTSSKWSDWTLGYAGNENNYTFNILDFYGLTNGTYAIKAFTNNKYGISVQDSSIGESANVILHTYTGLNSQKWNITYSGNGYYKIVNLNSNKSLDVAGGVPASETNLQQYTQNDSDAQKWLIKKNNDNSYSIMAYKFSNLFVDITGGVIADGTNMEIYTGNNSSAQKFTIENIGDVSTDNILINGDLIQFRIKTINNWGQNSTYLTTNSIPVRGNQMWIKINNTWKEGDTYFKLNNQWVEVTPYIKVNGVWKEST